MSLEDRLSPEAKAAADQLHAFRDKLEAEGIPAHAVRQMRWRSGEHRQFIKNAEGEIEYTEDLPSRGVEVLFRPQWEPEWPVVQRAAAVTVRSSRAKPQPLDGGWRKALIYPDTQIGWRRNVDGELVHIMHDPHAMACALAVAKWLRPDVQVCIGDDLDLAEISKFAQSPAFQRTIQPTLDVAHVWYGMLRATAPWSDVFVHDGNHNKRLPDLLKRNALAAFGIRRANMPDDWPALSVPHLLRFSELGITYVDGYPSDEHWLNDRLKTRHGRIVRKRGTAAAVVVDEDVSTIQGHIHRVEEQWLTRHTKDGPKRIMAASPGCLCQLNGLVPSFGSGEDARGEPVGESENWQHGIGIVYFHPDGRFFYQGHKIVDGTTVIDGRQIVGDPEHVAMLTERP